MLSIQNGCQTDSFYDASHTNRKPSVFLEILFEIEVSEVDGISNEIKFILPFTLFKTVHYICAEKILHLRAYYHYICAYFFKVNTGKSRWIQMKIVKLLTIFQFFFQFYKNIYIVVLHLPLVDPFPLFVSYNLKSLPIAGLHGCFLCFKLW